MAHDDPHGSVIEAFGVVEAEERDLEDSGGKHDLVLGGGRRVELEKKWQER